MSTSEAQEYDPFAAFEDVIAGTSRDPWPALAAKRRDAPVSKGLTIPPDVLPEGFSAEPEWIAYRYDDCSRILRDPKTFTSTGYDATIGMVMGHMILGMDDPEHRSHRNLVAHAFREKSLARWEPEFIAPIIDEQIDRFAADGEADLVRQLTFEFPVRVIARLLGLPEEDFPQFHRWSIELIGLVADIDRGLAASESLRDFFAGVVADRRAHPADDVISDLVSAEVEGEKLDQLELDLFFLLLIVAGNETTRNLMSGAMTAFFDHPDQWELLRQDRSLLPGAVEEMLRYVTPVMHFRRTATADFELRDQQIKEGDKIVFWHTSANRDEDAFEKPDTFDVTRSPNNHIAFGGGGPHFCLGANLARMEIMVMFDRLLERMPDMRLDGEVQRLQSNFINGTKHIPIAFAPSAPVGGTALPARAR